MKKPSVKFDKRLEVWYATWSNGYDRRTGKQVRRRVSFPLAKTKADAEAMRDKQHEAFASRGISRVGDGLVARLYWYCEKMKASGLADNTARAYLSDVKCYIEPYIKPANVTVFDFRPYMASDLYADLLDHGGSDGKGISGTTCRHVHYMLRSAFRYFCRLGVLEENPMAGLPAPRPDTEEAFALDFDSFDILSAEIASALTNDSYDFVNFRRRNVMFAAYLALNTGMRGGEVVAMERANVNDRTKDIRVSSTMVKDKKGKTTKGKRSRNVPLRDDVLEQILRMRIWQTKYLRESGLGVSIHTPLVLMPNGRHMTEAYLSHWFKSIVRELGLPDETHFHTLRHTAASYMLYMGVDIRTVQGILGHADPSTTLKAYAHAMPGQGREAIEKLGEYGKAGRGDA